MIKENVKSATKFNLVLGIVITIFIIGAEGACVSMFFTGPLVEAFFAAFFLQFMIFFLYLYAWLNFRAYKHRKNFDIYAIELTNDTDIEGLRRDNYICDITSKGILYVDRKDKEAFSDFNMSKERLGYSTFLDWYNYKNHPKSSLIKRIIGTIYGVVFEKFLDKLVNMKHKFERDFLGYCKHGCENCYKWKGHCRSRTHGTPYKKFRCKTYKF